MSESFPLMFSKKNNLCIIPNNALGSNQLIIREKLKIPEMKPCVEQINDVLMTVNIEDVRLVYIKDKRCKQLSIKAIVRGLIEEKIIYTAKLDEQPIHSAHFSFPFYSFIPFDFDIKLNNKIILDNLDFDFYSKNLDTYVCIEDITIKKINPKKFIKNLVVLITVNGDLSEIVERIKK